MVSTRCLAFAVMMAFLMTWTVAEPTSHAQQVDPSVLVHAEDLYAKAVKKMNEGNCDAACPLFEEVTRLVPEGIGAKLTLAMCYEKAGRLATAWSTFLIVEAAAKQADQPERQAEAREQADRLRPQLAQLTVTVPPSAQDLPEIAITCDGVTIPKAQWGSPFPIDKGKHVITATAKGRIAWEGTVEVESDGSSTQIEVGVPAEVVQDKRGAPPSLPKPAKPVTHLSAEKKSEPVVVPNHRATIGLVSAGLGMASLGAGVVLGIKAVELNSASNEDGHCYGDSCDAIGRERRRESLNTGTLSTIFCIAGGALLAGGVTLYLTAPSKSVTAKKRVTVGLQSIAMKMDW